MFGNTIGPAEIGIVLLIGLLIFGPKKLPELGKGLGRGMRDFKRAVTGDDDDERRAHELTSGPAASVTEPAAPVSTVVKAPQVDVQPVASATDDAR